MRRLVLEVSEKELSKIGINMPGFYKIKSLELLHFLRHDPEELAAVWRIELRDSNEKITDMLTNSLLAETQVLDHEKNGKYTVFMRTGPIISSALNFIDASGGYLFSPLEIRDGKLKLSFIGSESQVQEFLNRVNQIGIHYKVASLTDASFSPDSPLNKLTEKQREVLVAAHKLGYYEVPRKINSEQLAKKLGIGDSTLVEHLRKAEQRLINHILTEQ
jgi:predicted DNA binding protein